jgi:diguanylate cyclase
MNALATMMSSGQVTRRILIVDDNRAIHQDICGILRTRDDVSLASFEADLFGEAPKDEMAPATIPVYQMESAYQGEEALAMVEAAIREGNPYHMAFVDVRMPPGWDGIETIERIRSVDPQLQIVICSAYSDYSWASIHDKLRATDWLLILRKPFEGAEIQQIAHALTEKWHLAVKASLNVQELEELVRQHAEDLAQSNSELAGRNESLTILNDRLRREVEAREVADERIRHIAFHDALTDLPNRAFLVERLDECINRCKRQQDYQFGILFADVDDFKMVNDSLGHHAGDQLLSRLAAGMQRAMRGLHPEIRPSFDTVARLGGDEFVILLDDIKSSENALAVAERIRQAVCTSLQVGSRQMIPSLSFGVAMGNCDYSESADILRDADTALYHAKELGKGRVALFDHRMRARVLERVDVENDLHVALKNRQITAYYQPIVCLRHGKIVGFEALARWNHPSRGLLAPDSFLSVAEQAGLLEQIGDQIMDLAAGQLARWQAKFPGARNISISVNLSAGQLMASRLIEKIDRLLQYHGLSAGMLKVELTESAALRNLAATQRIIDTLTEKGVTVYLDDFGTGYSSLSTLHNLPVSAIKVDKSFVANLGSEIENDTTVRAILMIAENRDIPIIAEGIETLEQAKRLASMGCQYGQGYFFSRPVTAEAAEALIAADVVFWQNNGLSQMTPTQPVLA